MEYTSSCKLNERRYDEVAISHKMQLIINHEGEIKRKVSKTYEKE